MKDVYLANINANKVVEYVLYGAETWVRVVAERTRSTTRSK